MARKRYQFSVAFRQQYLGHNPSAHSADEPQRKLQMPPISMNRALKLHALPSALKQQANVRIGICIFMGIYFSPTEFLIHPLYLSFIAYSFAIFGIAHKKEPRCIGPSLVFLTLSFDVIFTIASLYLVDAYGYFLFLILIQICFGYGVRYGSLILWASTLVACLGILTLFFISEFWKNRPFEIISFLAGVPFLAAYIHFLNAQLETAKLKSEMQTATYSKLLAFVSHDIRAQLQTLLGASEEMLAEKPSSSAVKHIFRMREIVHSLARLATNFVHEQPEYIERNYQKEVHLAHDVCALGEWLGRISSRFSPQIRANGIRFIVDFTADVPTHVRIDALSLERLLINNLSNAVRYAKNGSLEIKLDLESREDYQGRLSIRISNSCPGGFNQIAGDDVEVLSQRVYFGSGLGHAISHSIALEAGGSFAARVVGPGAFLCEMQMPCSFPSALMPKPMAYPAVYFSKSIENYQRAKELLAYTCGLYRCNPALYPAMEINQDVDNVNSFLFDPSDESEPPDERINVENIKSESIRCDVHLCRSSSGVSVDGHLNCAALATLSLYSITGAIAFAAAYNQKDAKLQEALLSAGLDDAKLSGIYIEDSNFNANAVLAAAHRQGWNLDRANLVTQALSMLRCNSYDFMLVDWELGDGTAADILDGHHHFSSPSAGPRIIIVSGHESARLRQLLGHRRVHKILEKPISAEALIEQIAACCRPDHSISSSAWERLMLAPQELFDCSSYETLSDRPAERDTAIYLLDALITEIEAAFGELNQLSDFTTSEFRRVAHRLIGAADAGGARMLANCARTLLSELNEGDEFSLCDLHRLTAVWVVTVPNIRIFQATLC